MGYPTMRRESASVVGAMLGVDGKRGAGRLVHYLLEQKAAGHRHFIRVCTDRSPRMGGLRRKGHDSTVSSGCGCGDGSAAHLLKTRRVTGDGGVGHDALDTSGSSQGLSYDASSPVLGSSVHPAGAILSKKGDLATYVRQDKTVAE
eukprot:25541-Rhodomonas_salina.1